MDPGAGIDMWERQHFLAMLRIEPPLPGGQVALFTKL
jgi:hypothetical protein